MARQVSIEEAFEVATEHQVDAILPLSDPMALGGGAAVLRTSARGDGMAAAGSLGRRAVLEQRSSRQSKYAQYTPHETTLQHPS
jgi:hypothetical protein